ncbi:hypothetical protein [Cellulomonas sp. URHB0016]
MTELESTLRVSSIAAVVVAAVTAATLTALPASASGPSAGGSITSPSAPAEGNYEATDPNATPAFIAKWDPYVTLSGNRFVIAAPDSVVMADPEGYAQAADLVSKTNASTIVNPLRKATSGKTILATGSHGGGTVHWWGYSLWLDNVAVTRLQAALAGGATAAGTAALLTSWTGIGGMSGGAITAVLGIGAGVLTACNWNGNGINIHAEWLTVFPASWCWAR